MPYVTFYPMKSIFSRDEYQNTIGNLPHIYMMVEMPLEDMTQEKKDTLEELIRSYVFDIVRAEDIQNLKDEGIIKNIDDVLDIKKDATNFLLHKCSMQIGRASCRERV